MSNPTQIAQIGVGGTAGGSILSAGGSIMSGISTDEMYNYQSGMAKLNQQIDYQNEELARQTGEQSALQFGLKASQQLAQIKAAQSSSGFDLRSGSAAQVRSSQRSINTLDTDVIRSNAAKTAFNYDVAGTVAGSQAKVYSSAASNALAAGFIGAGSSVLGGIGSVSDQWLKGQQSNLWGAPT